MNVRESHSRALEQGTLSVYVITRRIARKHQLMHCTVYHGTQDSNTEFSAVCWFGEFLGEITSPSQDTKTVLGASIYDVNKIFWHPPHPSHSQISWFCSFRLLLKDPHPLQTSYMEAPAMYQRASKLIRSAWRTARRKQLFPLLRS